MIKFRIEILEDEQRDFFLSNWLKDGNMYVGHSPEATEDNRWHLRPGESIGLVGIKEVFVWLEEKKQAPIAVAGLRLEKWECSECHRLFRMEKYDKDDQRLYKVPEEMMKHDKRHEAKGEAFAWIIRRWESE